MKEFLEERNIMPVWQDGCYTIDEYLNRRREIVDLLCFKEYGYLPPKPEQISFSEVSEKELFLGKVILKKIIITTTLNGKPFSFPIYHSMPKTVKKLPFFVMINFRDSVPDVSLPIDEICERGYAVISFCYKDITSDDGDFNDGLAGIIYDGQKRNPHDCGKIAMWAWAASRAMDYALTIPELDSGKATVIGHSRLGKTALLAGATDERFYCAISNNSGCCGAALSRNKVGENLKIICNAFPHWFCENFMKYVDREMDLPFDQHFLIAAMVPRKVYVSSSSEDLWADPVSEYLSCCAADEVYAKIGMEGFTHPNRLPVAGDVFHQGSIGYHLKEGKHSLISEDWHHFIDYLNIH